MYFLLAVFSLAFVYVALSANPSGFNIALGLFMAAGIALLLRPGRRLGWRALEWRRLPSAVFALLIYTGILFRDLFVSGFQVARIVLDPRMPIRPGILAIPSGCDDETETALSAHAITLTPGELVVEIDDQGVMFTHCLDLPKSERLLPGTQKRRRLMLDRIFK
jgi:multicomponent Na+:H+ antiporter subunit E